MQPSFLCLNTEKHSNRKVKQTAAFISPEDNFYISIETEGSAYIVHLL